MKKLFVIFAIIFVLAACASPSSVQPEVSPSVPVESASSESSEPAGPIGIKGSHITDILLGLEQSRFEIPNPNFKSSSDHSISTHYAATSLYNPGVGMTFDYHLSAAADFSIISGSFGITNTDFLAGEDDFLSIAKSYLGFCATMPCDATSGSLSGVAKDWVVSAIDDHDKWKSGVAITWDDARFSVDWSKTSDGEIIVVWMPIERVDPSGEEEKISDEDAAKYEQALKNLEKSVHSK